MIKKSAQQGFTNLVILILLLMGLGLSLTLLKNTQVFRSKASDPTINISVDLSTPEGISQIATGATHTQYSADSWNNSTAVSSARQLLSASVTFQNQHIMGWGTENPWPDKNIPDPTKWNWGSLDDRINLIRQTGGIPIITLAGAPDWMKGGVNGQTDWTKLEVAPLPEYETDFANLAKRVALRYPDVSYFQVWNEFKGMWSTSAGCTPSVCGANRWDYERYTRLYNLVYDAIKSVRPDANIGGPYVILDNWSSTRQSNPSSVSGPYGVLDQRPLDVIKYWLQNKHGAQFLTIDGGPNPKDNVWVTDEFSAGQYFVDTIKWIRTLDNTLYPGANTLPVWWAEWYASTPNSGLNINHDNAVMASDLIYTVKSGASLPLIWGPQGDTKGFSFPVGIWTDTKVTGGGLATPFYNVVKAFHDSFGAGTKLYKTSSTSSDIAVLASSSTILLVNKTSLAKTIAINNNTLTLNPFEVKKIANISTTPTIIPTSTPTPILTPTPTSSAIDKIPPTITITNPSNNSFVFRNSTVNITASAQDNQEVKKVEFYINGNLKCTNTTPPYTCTWKVGQKRWTTYTLTAKAYDNADNISTTNIKVTSK